MPKKKGQTSKSGSSSAAVCQCEDPYRCTCGLRPERPSKGHKWDPVAKAWGGKGHKQKGAALGQAATVARDKVITTTVGQTTLLPHQRLPSTILREYCQKQKHRPDPNYKPIKSKGNVKYQLTIPSTGNKESLRFLPATAVPNAEQAREEAALLALLYFTPTLPHERKLPEPYRTTWLQALQAQKEEGKPNGKETAGAQATSQQPTRSSKADSTGSTFTNTAQASSGLRSAISVNRSTAQAGRVQARAARNVRIAKHEAIRLANQPHPVFMSAQLRKAIARLLRNEDDVMIQEESDECNDAYYLDSMQTDVQDYVEERLHAEGFTRKQARQGFSQIKVSSGAVEQEWEHMYEEALQWLLVNADEQDLPPSFDPRGRTLDVIAGGKPSQTMASKAGPVVKEFAQKHGLPIEDAALIFKDQLNDEQARNTLWETACRLAQVDNPSDAEVTTADPTLLEDELEALKAIFVDECHVSQLEAGSQLIIRLPLDEVFHLQISLDKRSYPMTWPLQIVVESESASHEWTQGLSLLVEIARFMSNEIVLGEPMAFVIHGQIMELLQNPEQLPVVALVDPDSRGPPTKEASLPKNRAGQNSAESELEAPAPKFVPVRKRPRERAAFWSIPPDRTPPAVPYPTGALKRARAALPAARARSEFLSALRRADKGSRVVLCTGETGCGKSTQLPQFILEEYPKEAKIVVCQPRRLAATGVATRVAEERGEQRPGEESVGYVVRGDTAIGNKSRLVFCTTGVLLRQLQNDGALDCLTHIVIDEVHERNLDTDILLALLKRKLQKDRQSGIRVVLMSATIDADRFMSYWDGGETPRIHIPGRTFPVQDFMLEDVLALTQYIPPKQKKTTGGRPNSDAGLVETKDEEMTEGSDDETEDQTIGGHSIADMVKRVDESSIDYNLLAQLVRALVLNKDPSDDGSVLIFLPGAPEIDRALETVRKVSRELPVQLLPLHGGLQPKEQSRVFQPANAGLCKVIFSTNVAETSVTIPDCTIVIDSAREKQSSYDPSNRMPLLLEQFCSKASLKQRRGRAGRVREGVCYKLISKSTYAKLRDHGEPEIRRSALDQTLLSIMFLGMECTPKGGFLDSLLDPPDRKSIEAAAMSLANLGALESCDSTTAYRLTPLGIHLAGIPAPPMVGKVLIMGAILGCRDAAIAMAAGMSVARSPFLRIDTRRKPRRAGSEDPSDASNIEEAKQKRVLADRQALFQTVGKSDHALLVAVYRQWHSLDKGSPRRQFCDKLGLSFPGMRDLSQLANQFDVALRSLGYGPSAAANRHGQSWRVIRAVAVAGLSPGQLVKVVRPAAAYHETAEGAKEKDGEARQLKFLVRTTDEGDPEKSKSHAKSNKEERVFVHPSSANFATGSYACPWLVYFSLVRTSKPFLRDVTECNSYALLLFGGPLQVQASRDVVIVDGWCQLGCHARIGSLMGGLRSRLDDLLTQKISNPSLDIADTREMKVIIRLIMTDGLGS